MSKVFIKNKSDVIVSLNSFAVAIMLVSTAVTRTLVSISFLENVSNNFFVLLAVIVCVVTSIWLSKKVVIQSPTFFLMLLVCISYIVTLIFHSSETTINIVHLMFFSIIPIYLISQRIDPEKILRYSLYLSLISIPVIDDIFVIQYEKYSQSYMGNVFSILPTVIIAMIHFAMYRKNSDIVIKIAYVYNLYILVKIMLYANRGAVACVLFCLLVLMLNTYENEKRVKLKTKKAMLFFVLFIVLIVVLVNLLPILEAASAFLEELFGFVPSFISKMIKYLRDGDVTDGRIAINNFTIRAIKDEPLFGHGIETFEKYALVNASKSWPYPHQYILQYLFEGGVVFSLIPIWLSLSLTVKVVVTGITEKREFALCCTLVCLCIPKLLLSTDVWDSTAIWMLITYSLIYTIKQSRNNNGAVMP